MVVQPTAQLAPWLLASLAQLENCRMSLKFVSVDCSVIVFLPEVVHYGQVLFVRILVRTNQVPCLGTSKEGMTVQIGKYDGRGSGCAIRSFYRRTVSPPHVLECVTTSSTG